MNYHYTRYITPISFRLIKTMLLFQSLVKIIHLFRDNEHNEIL